MNRTAGEMRSAARNPRRSATYRSRPLRLPRTAATLAIFGSRLYMVPGTVATIELQGLTKVYADGTRAVHELDLDIADGEFVVFVGPSGCGKTSALRMIAGLEEISDGAVL